MTVRFTCASQVQIAVAERSDAAECRRVVKRLGEAARFDETTAGRAAIVVTELATNILRHAGRGEILLQLLDDGHSSNLEMLAIDKGPGMNNVDECLRDGYSTSGTLGTGLGAISRMSSTFDIFSAPAHGTIVLSRLAAQNPLASPAARGAAFEFGAVSVALAGEVECGDAWCIARSGEAVSVLVVDGLGHGPLAARASNDAVESFKKTPFDAPAALMRNLHAALNGGRGAAAACMLLQPPESKAAYAGVGNISGHLVSAERSRGMVSHNGTLGVQLLRAQQFEYDWSRASRFVMHSDGLSGRWNINSYPGLYSKHPAIIAATLYRDFVRRRDDATIVVGCHRP